MKILMVPEFFPPVLGGVGQHAASLTKALAERGHCVSVLTLGWKGLKHYEKVNGFEVYRIPGLFQRFGFIYGNKNYRFHPPVSDPVLVKKVDELIRSLKPDVIHCHGWMIYSMLKLKKSYKIPLIFTLHDYGLVCPTRTMYKGSSICKEALVPECVSCSQAKVGAYKARAMYWALNRNKSDLNLVDKFIAVSSSVKEVHQYCLNISEENIEVVHNFYGLDGHAKDIKSVSLPDDFILFAGALKPEKGVDVLIEAYRKLNTEVKLVIIGMKRPSYQLMIDDSVILLENQPRHVVMEAWKRCRFGLVPSVWSDPCPTVALEAMACGKAVVGSDVGGLKDIVVDRETGLLVPPGDVESLAEAMNKLLTIPDLAIEMGSKGYRRLKEHFTVDRVVLKIENLYIDTAS